MVRILYRLIGTVLLVLVLGPLPTAEAQSLSATVDSIGEALVAQHPGAAVIGMTSESEVDFNGYPATGRAVIGFGSVDTAGTPPTAQTVFEIGSVTKAFTGLLLADAVERGVVQPNDPVARFLPDSLALPGGVQTPITLMQLATHRSGLPRIPSNLFPPANPADPYAHYTVEDLYAFLDGYQRSDPLDTTYAYSNLGTGLLGHALARQADTSYGALVQQHIAAPLGLDDTRIDLTPAQQERFAQGYNPAGAPTPPWQIPTLAGAGALRSTAADMMAYLNAHLTAADTTELGRSLRRAITPQADVNLGDNPEFAGTRIGYGWHITPRSGQSIVWHNGGTGGFSSFIGFNRATGQGVIVLVSVGGAGRQATTAGFTLLEHLAMAAQQR
jgi:CubicO group peptidase (beta-lactamase class C family)